ncbi:galactose oxidase [Flagelloscypha sp. PMI_526]|nr:galactose oxidase [Flagelloscypha sp. PMI_526]
MASTPSSSNFAPSVAGRPLPDRIGSPFLRDRNGGGVAPDSPLLPPGSPYLQTSHHHLASASSSTLPPNRSPKTETPPTQPPVPPQKDSPKSTIRKPSSTRSMRNKGAAAGEEKQSRSSTAKPPAPPSVPVTSTSKIKPVPKLYFDTRAAPVSSMLMHWAKAPVHGSLPLRSMRAHTVTLANDNKTAWIFGGCDEKECASDVYMFDCETMAWSRPLTAGDLPPPCRAHTATLIDHRIVMLGGGQGGVYYDTVYVFNTITRRWSRPAIEGDNTNLSSTTPHIPAPRRAHTAVLYDQKIWIFGGGNGIQALNDVYCLEYRAEGDTTPWKWNGPIRTTGQLPPPRGYHTSTLVKNVMVVVGGSDGGRCFDDVHCLNLDTLRWLKAPLTQTYNRLSHTATLIGSYLFITGGHDGTNYVDSVLALNLVALQYETRRIAGKFPSPRGYHASVLCDRRMWIIGGYQGAIAYDDVWCLDLASNGYLPDVISFTVGMGLG